MSQVPRPGHDQADPGARHVLLRSDDQQEMIQPPVAPADSEAGSDQQATGCTGTDQPSSAGADDRVSGEYLKEMCISHHHVLIIPSGDNDVSVCISVCPV